MAYSAINDVTWYGLVINDATWYGLVIDATWYGLVIDATWYGLSITGANLYESLLMLPGMTYSFINIATLYGLKCHYWCYLVWAIVSLMILPGMAYSFINIATWYGPCH